MKAPTAAEWLAAVDAISEREDDQDAFTSDELTGVFKLGRSQTRARIRALIAAGRGIATTKAVIRADGQRQWVPAFRLKEDVCASNSTNPSSSKSRSTTTPTRKRR